MKVCREAIIPSRRTPLRVIISGAPDAS
jgi:hypothetical protein